MRSPDSPDRPRRPGCGHLDRVTDAGAFGLDADTGGAGGPDHRQRLPSTLGALLLATGPGRSLLDTNPVVAVDRRGLADSSAVDCLTRDERTAIFTNGQVGRARDTAARIRR